MYRKKQRHSFTDTYARMFPEILEGNLITKNITFVLTESCQLSCSYCYQGHKTSKSMSFDVAKKAVDMIFREYNKGSRYINEKNAYCVILDFIGGEPLLNIEVMDYIVEYFKKKAVEEKSPWARHYMISISTNGIAYDTLEFKNFMQRNLGRVSCSITMDGCRELHDACRRFPDGRGSYDIVEKAVIDQIKNFGQTTTKLTISPDNVIYLNKALENLYSLGMTDVYANCVYEEGWTLEHAKILYKQMKDIADWILDNNMYENFSCSLFDDWIGHPMGDDDNRNWCGGTGDMLAIGTDGKIYPCLRYMEYSLGPDVKPITIGNVDSGIESTKEESRTIDCLQCITRRSQSTDKCYNCPIAKGCAWCSAYNYQVNGTADSRVTYICDMHKARVLANAYYFNKLYAKEGSEDKFAITIPDEWALEIVSEKELLELKNL